VRLNVSKGSGVVTVPTVVGSLASDGESKVQAAGLTPNVVRVPSQETAGTIVAQNPTGGQAKRGSIVRLNVSTGAAK
jgi:beta-lactam-binding protein with PASTA domain